MKVLETDRLILRHLNVDDDEFIYELVNDPSFIRYIGDKGVRTLDDARNYILNGPVAMYEKLGYGLYATELKDGRVPVGMCGILKRDTLPHPDIGFAFLPSHWKHGYAFESAAAVIKHAREVLGIDQVLAITTPDNEASVKLLEKIGLRFERLIKLTEDAPEVKLFSSES
jgi:RimJ/RimL family protein N-acetyltransferase